MSKILLVPALYQHFFIEHHRGHHRYVATPEDPATARFGENLYHFWFRSTFDGIRNVWKLEEIRLLNAGHRIYSFYNQMLQFVFIQGLYLGNAALVFYFFGGLPMSMIILVAIIGFLMLESINYIEHYGLLRLKKENGRYEKVSFGHSWNSNHDLGRILLYKLTRHADHHNKASKKHQLLKHVNESSQLPTGYPGCIILAMIPPWWFSVMNRRVPPQMIRL